MFFGVGARRFYEPLHHWVLQGGKYDIDSGIKTQHQSTEGFSRYAELEIVGLKLSASCALFKTTLFNARA